MAQLASVLAWGARGRKFESSHPDVQKKGNPNGLPFLFFCIFAPNKNIIHPNINTMKKLLLLCIASCLLFPLYGQSHPTYGNDEVKSVISSHKEGGPAFKAFMRLFDQTEENIKNCKTCDELDAVFEKFLDDLAKISDQYNDDDLTEAEEEVLEQQLQEIEKLVDIQVEKLCGDSMNDGYEKKGDKNSENVGEGSPAYLEIMGFIDDLEKQLNKCTSCERLTILANRFSEDFKEIQMTYGSEPDLEEWEEERLDERFDDIDELFERKYTQLCGDD